MSTSNDDGRASSRRRVCPSLQPIFDDQAGHALEVAPIVSDQRGIVVEGDAGNLEVQVAQLRPGAFRFDVQQAEAAGGGLVVRQDEKVKAFSRLLTKGRSCGIMCICS